MKSRQQDMLNGPLLPSIVKYTVPIMLTSILQLLFNAADLVVVGRFCGSVSVAAVGATGAITNLIVNLFIGLSVGIGVTVAHAMGRRDDAAVHRAIHTAVPTAFCSGVILTVVGILLAGPMLRAMGTPESVLPLSELYMKIYFGGMVFNLVYNFSASILRATGDTKSPLIFLCIAGLLNVVLNVILVTVVNLNVAGVAIATVSSQALSAVLVVITLMRRTDATRLVLSKLRFYKHEFIKICRIGFPAGIQGALFSISNVIIQSSVNSFGDVLMSGNAAASNIEGFVYVMINAFYQATVNFVGQNVGAQQWKRVRRIVWISLACGFTIAVIFGNLASIFSEQLLSIYITDSQEAISYGQLRMSILAVYYFTAIFMEVGTGALRGLGASLMPMLISVMGICVFRVGWIYTIFQIPEFHTPACLYISYPISWLITGATQILVFLHIFKKRRNEAEIQAAAEARRKAIAEQKAAASSGE